MPLHLNFIVFQKRRSQLRLRRFLFAAFVQCAYSGAGTLSVPFRSLRAAGKGWYRLLYLLAGFLLLSARGSSFAGNTTFQVTDGLPH